MTEHSEKVEQQKKILEEEAKQNQITMLEYRFENGQITQEVVQYASGKVVVKYADKRKKDKVTNGGY
jgi:hypothetical protein